MKKTKSLRRRPLRPDYWDISQHGIIGDRHSAALVSIDGSIDWFCVPHFDSPSVFARILDHRKGGFFQIRLRDKEMNRRQLYLPNTNVLLTRFMTSGGVAEVMDFMPLDRHPDTPPLHRLVRRVRVLRGRVNLELECRPAFDYARVKHKVRKIKGGLEFVTDDVQLVLEGSLPLRAAGPSGKAKFQLEEGENATFMLRIKRSQPKSKKPSRRREDFDVVYDETVEYWRDWASKCTYQGRWREQVIRSALALKLLTYEPSGAIIAAPTTSLPEQVGGRRNWDYRYAWLRDSSYVVNALLDIGYAKEAGRFTEWLLHRIEESDPRQALMPLYCADGSVITEEFELPHLEGHRGSRPVRVGNLAAKHLQLDVYGAILDAIHAYERGGARISHELWLRLVVLLDWVCENWRRPDHGIWEIRAEPKQHTFSKIMCWVALDRGLRIARRRGFPAHVKEWTATRDLIYATVMTQGWNEKRKSLVATLGGDLLDASLLLIPALGFLAPKDPRMVSTLEAIKGDLEHGYMVRRYDYLRVDDGLNEPEGFFGVCGFWLVDALTSAGRLDEARLLFETLLGYSNELGLCSEQISDAGEPVGNIPQALTHLALIQAAVKLDKALGAGA